MLLRLKQNMPTERYYTQITDNRRLYFRDAYHPILYLNNKQKRKLRIRKTIELQQNYCNSGPNAGGKTISLKTVGLLQLMLYRNVDSGS
jgi:DNA mismatch repair protein MutS2